MGRKTFYFVWGNGLDHEAKVLINSIDTNRYDDEEEAYKLIHSFKGMLRPVMTQREYRKSMLNLFSQRPTKFKEKKRDIITIVNELLRRMWYDPFIKEK